MCQIICLILLGPVSFNFVFFCIIQLSNFLWNFLQKIILFFKFAREIGGGTKLVRVWSVVPFFLSIFFFSNPIPETPLGLRPRFARKKCFVWKTSSNHPFLLLLFCSNEIVRKLFFCNPPFFYRHLLLEANIITKSNKKQKKNETDLSWIKKLDFFFLKLWVCS